MANADHIVSSMISFEEALLEMECVIKSYGDLSHFSFDQGGESAKEPAWLTVVSLLFWRLRDSARPFMDVVYRDAIPAVKYMDSLPESKS